MPFPTPMCPRPEVNLFEGYRTMSSATDHAKAKILTESAAWGMTPRQ